MAVIRTVDLHKIYDEDTVPVHALNGVSLAVEEGEFTAIVGPSGSGKTTLLNMIGGLDKPSRGSVFIDEQDITSYSDNQLIDFRLKHIGFVFQAYNLIPVLTAYENVEFIMLLQKRPKEERRVRAMELLRAVGLEEKTEKRPTELSGGQQQRVAVARALASKPRFVLADEPTANLDMKHKNQFWKTVMQLRSQGKGGIIVSHEIQVPDGLFNNIIGINNGKILMSGEPMDILQPQNLELLYETPMKVLHNGMYIAFPSI